MAVIMTKRGSQDNIITYEYYCDTIKDRANIDPSNVTLGSVCIVVEGQSGGLEAYVANSNGEWKEV